MNQNAASRKDIRQAEKVAKLADIRAREVMTELMSTPAGREWIWNLLAYAHIFAPNTVPDARMSGIFDGERNFGLRLLNDIMLHCPDQYVQAARESNERTASAERSRQQNTDRGDSGSEFDPDPYAGTDPYSDAEPDTRPN